MEHIDFNLLYRWFVGLTMDDEVWDHSTFSANRDRKKSEGDKAQLCFLGHALMENRNGLVVDAQVTQATGPAEREAAQTMVKRTLHKSGATLGADKN